MSAKKKIGNPAVPLDFIAALFEKLNGDIILTKESFYDLDENARGVLNTSVRFFCRKLIEQQEEYDDRDKS